MNKDVEDIIKSFCDKDVTIKLDKYPLYNTSNINLNIVDNRNGYTFHVVTSLNIDYDINSRNKDVALNLFKKELEEDVKSAKKFFNKIIDYEKSNFKQG